MDFSDLLTVYLYWNAVFSAGFLATVFLVGAVKYFSLYLLPFHILKIVRGVLVIIILFPILFPLIPRKILFTPTAQIWSAPSIRSGTLIDAASGRTGFLSFDLVDQNAFISFNIISPVLSGLILLGMVFGLVRVMKKIRDLRRRLRQAHPIRKIGRVRILVWDQAEVPFSIWRPGRSLVVLPSSLLENLEHFRIALVHELQHHRQRDTVWAYVIQILKIVSFWNPAIYLLEKNMSEIQELACDEFLVGHRRIPPLAYGSCLIRAAEIAIKRRIPECAVGMPLSVSGKKLKRRIDMMFISGKRKKTWGGALLCGFFSLVFMVAVCFASQGLVQDRRISLPEAKELAKKAGHFPGFPLVVNDRVLAQLNAYLGTPDGREYMRESLCRLEEHRETIERKLQEYGVPRALLAVPLVESGYRNLVQNHPVMAAGLWQFIPATAKHYGLRVNDAVDERLDVELETDAAVRYLLANHLRFRDWGLSLLAYNAGAGRVQEGIDATGTRDAWALIQAGYENDRDYLGKIVAALIIMYNPSSLE